MSEREAVAVTTGAGDRHVGLVLEERTDGPAGGPQQDRVVVATSQDEQLREIDTAADRAEPVEASQADLVRQVVGARLDDQDGDGDE